MPERQIHSRAGQPPTVAVIVPVAGSTGNLEKHLHSLLCQHYSEFQVIFVTQDDDDPAVPIIERVIAGQSRASRITAGRAVACSQKNHNLIEGVRAAPDSTEILVFCDSGHYAHPRWLERLIAPLLKSSAAVSSGYHHVIPEDNRVSSTGRAICVQGLYLARLIPALTQPWGGATAIRKADFHKLGVAERWSTTVVDDVTLADLLARNKMSTVIPEGADLQTTVTDCSWSSWQSWLVRQWAYLKFLFPWLWLSAGLAMIAFALLVSFSIIVVLAWGLEIFPDQTTLWSALLLFAVAVAATLCRMRHPAPGPVTIWYPAFLAALVMAGWCHCRTWFSGSITWAGIVYTVAAGGQVVSICRPDEGPPQEMTK